jgi:N-acetylglucosamine-6-phosphate deacetylase
MTGFTHLFNGMSQLTNRAPGMVGAALEERSTYAGIIVDGHHIHPATLRVAISAKGTDRLMLVTDAMPTVGDTSNEFLLQGRSIRKEGDRLVSEDGVLAGSTLTMASAVANAVEQGHVSLAQAIEMATSSPAHFLGISSDTGSIRSGMRADLVAMRDDFTVANSWIAGQSDPARVDAR